MIIKETFIEVRGKMRPRSQHNKGFFFISILMALVIIMILSGYMLGGDKKENIPPAKTYIDRGSDTACTANRQVLETQIQMWMISHPGETPTIEKLKQSGVNVPTCPAGGTYTIDSNYKVHCSKHGADQIPR